MSLSLHVTIRLPVGGDGLSCNDEDLLLTYYDSCSSMQTFHTDVNECEDDGLNHCHENASCTNTEGSFNCDCNDGYSGSGVECTGS